MKTITVFTFLIFILSCDKPKEKLDKIPNDFTGVWIDEFGEFQMEIKASSINFVEIGQFDTIYKKINAIYYEAGKSCSDCNPNGLRVEFEDDLNLAWSIFLNARHPKTNSYNRMELYEEVENPYADKREVTGQEVWMRELN